MSDFFVKEFREKEGLWVCIDDYLVFIDDKENHYCLPKELTITHYEIDNFSKDMYYVMLEKKQFNTFKRAVKDTTKKLANKREGYQYGIYLHYTWSSGKEGRILVASIRKSKEHFGLHVPGIRSHFENGKLEEDEQKWIKEATLPDTWLFTRRVNRPIALLEKELKEAHHVKEIVYTASHPHKEKEAFLRTIERYFVALSHVVDTDAFPLLTINHGHSKSFTGNYWDWTKEMMLQPKTYTSFFHLYWFHIYYGFLESPDGEKACALFERLVEKLYAEETMTHHLKNYQRILNKKGEVLAEFKHKQSGKYHEQFVSPHQMIARLFSDYFFYHYGSAFEMHERKKSFHFTDKEITVFSPLVENLLSEANKYKKKSTS